MLHKQKWSQGRKRGEQKKQEADEKVTSFQNTALFLKAKEILTKTIRASGRDSEARFSLSSFFSSNSPASNDFRGCLDYSSFKKYTLFVKLVCFLLLSLFFFFIAKQITVDSRALIINFSEFSREKTETSPVFLSLSLSLSIAWMLQIPISSASRFEFTSRRDEG